MSVEIVSAPTEAENYLYALLQDESGIDLAEFCYIDERNQEGGGIFRAYPFQVPWYRDKSKLHVDAAGRCIMEGQLVLTSAGWVPIQYVRVGDLVLTHMNRWRPVTHVWDRGLKTTVLVRTVDQPNELICTPDHEVWADNGDVQDWVHASDLAGTALASPSGFETVDGPYSDLSLDLQNALARLGKEGTLAGLQFSARDRQTYLDIQLTAAQYGFSVNAYRSQDHSSINGVVVPALECHNGKVWTQVQKIYPYGVRHVWDLTVEEDSSFVCEGYVVHNSIGKALDVETPMLTSKGWTTMGELVEGDQLFTERGKLTTVTKAHKVLKNRECFSVTFSDDSSIVADADHLWTVYTYEYILHADRFGGNAAPQIKTTKEILENLITTVRDDDTLELSELPTYRVPFVDKLDLSNTNLSNKDLYLAQSRLGGHIAREIVSVEPVKSRPVRCIEVDNATKIFLAGPSLIPTHNSMSIILRGLAFPFAYPGEEMMITAPEHIHLQAVWDKLEKATLSTRLSREFLKGKPQHRPYQLSFQNNARIMGRIPQKTGAGLQGCVEHNTLILTEGGYRPAKDIQVGERVWSHEGRWTEVLYNGTFEAEGYEVSGAGALPVIINDAHRFFGVRSIDHNPKKKIEYGEPEWLDFRQLSEERCYWALPRMEGIPSPVDCAGYTENEDEAWLLGLYAADGYHVSEKGSMGNQIRHRICFVAHPSNHAEIIGAIERLGLKVSVRKRSHSSADILEVSNKSLAIKALSVGSNAKSKSVPAHILFASIGVRRAFFEGYMFGDGGSDERGRKASTTISQLLSAGIRHLALSLGYSPSISMYQPLQTHVKGVRLKSTPQLQYRSKFSDVISAHHDADYIYGRVKPAMRPVGLCTFADLVTGDHSYVSNGVLSHNTHPLVLELDEAGNFPESAWVEVRETLEDRPGATWRCIASGEQVLMSGCQWKAIEDVRVGDYVWTHNGSTQRVLNVFDNGEAECFRYSDDFHHTVLATDDHKFLVGDNVHTPISDAVFAPAQIMDTWYSYRGGATPSASVITSKESVGRRRVYDLEVEGDHSYCVGGVFVSNCHGVSFGYGSTFNKLISGDDPHWTVRKLPSMNRPTWSDTVRQERIAAYGGYDSDGYRRNVLGLTSDPSGSPLFVMNRLYACVDSDAMSDYNTDEYYQPIIQESQVRDIEAEGGGIEDLINIPASHMAYKRVWIASDLGWTISPTSITVFAEVKNDEGKGALKLISRILLHKISAHDQMRVVMFLMDIYQPQCYALDATGAGFVLWDIMLEEMGKDPSTAWMRERVKDINFSSKVIVGFDDSVEVSPHEGLDGLMRAAIMQPFVIASTDQMRKLIDDKRMILPFDEDLLQELQDPTIKGNKISSLDAYGKSGRKKGMHNLDAMRMAVHSYESRELDLMMSSSKNTYAPPPIMFG